MKDLGRSTNGGFIIELSENEHQSLVRLAKYAGDEGEDYFSGVTYPTPERDICGWTDAIYVWLANKQHLEEIRDGAIKLLDVLSGKDDKVDIFSRYVLPEVVRIERELSCIECGASVRSIKPGCSVIEDEDAKVTEISSVLRCNANKDHKQIHVFAIAGAPDKDFMKKMTDYNSSLSQGEV